MSEKDKPDFLDVTAIRQELGLRGMPWPIFLLALIIWILIAAMLLFGVCKIVWDVIWQLPPTDQIETWNWRFSIAQLAALTTVLGAVIVLPLTMSRLVLTRRQTETTEQGQITDRINKAVEGLGTEKKVSRMWRSVTFEREGSKVQEIEGREVKSEFPADAQRGKWQIADRTMPNLEVRIGAIYALERIAQDSDRDHVQIMEILCAYIRQNAPAPETDDWPELQLEESEEDAAVRTDWFDRLRFFNQAQAKIRSKLKPREDIQVAMRVIGRRSTEQRQIEAGPGRGKKALDFVFDHPPADQDRQPDNAQRYRQGLHEWQSKMRKYAGYQLDLRGVDLRGMDLSGVNLNGARLDGTYLDWTDLKNAKLQGAVLWQARLRRTFLGRAELRGARLGETPLTGADLGEAKLQGAFLGEIALDDHTFSEKAKLNGAALRGKTSGDVTPFEQYKEVVFSDLSVGELDGKTPKHWSTKVLNPTDFLQEWASWLSGSDAAS